jgi:uncharacterized membrane protein YeaQ/YmgE (transglycosylase-associated protein family)
MNRGRQDGFKASGTPFGKAKNNMYPDYSGFAFPAYLQLTLIALLLSTTSGVLASLVLKLRVRGGAIAKDAFLGAVGCVIAVSGLWQLGSRENGWYNFPTGVVVAIVIPILRESYRFKRARPKVE